MSGEVSPLNKAVSAGLQRSERSAVSSITAIYYFIDSRGFASISSHVLYYKN